MFLALNKACCRLGTNTRITFSVLQQLSSLTTANDAKSSNTSESTSGTADAASPSIRSDLPVMTSRALAHLPLHIRPRQAWLETLSTADNEKLGFVDLHPDIFATFPRIDIIWYNIFWQRLYKFVDYRHMNNRAEMRGGGRKPWPQKGTGRARHGSIRSPLFINGGKTYGPRGPQSYFFMLPTYIRVLGLRAALSAKFAQDNLHIVDSLDMPTDDPKYLTELVESRGWGLSVLFVDDTDVVPKNIALATDKIKPYNVMPVYGLNVYSMLKHETVVLTLAALERIEERLLSQMHSMDFREHNFQKQKRLGYC
jgi:large subunit ribosomal protein L4